MNVKKLLILIVLFYFLALLQSSFLIHFNLFGAVPNLVFILFFMLVFFEKNKQPVQLESYYSVAYTAIIAGIFLDFFSYTYLGPSTILFLAIGLILKKLQSSLINKNDNNPFVYFSFLFVIFLLIYNFLLGLFLSPNNFTAIFSVETFFLIIYNLLIAFVLFYIYKKLNGKNLSNKKFKP